MAKTHSGETGPRVRDCTVGSEADVETRGCSWVAGRTIVESTPGSYRNDDVRGGSHCSFRASRAARLLLIVLFPLSLSSFSRYRSCSRLFHSDFVPVPVTPATRDGPRVPILASPFGPPPQNDKFSGFKSHRDTTAEA